MRKLFLIGYVLLLLLFGCKTKPEIEFSYEEMIALTQSPPAVSIEVTAQHGILTKEAYNSIIDYTNIAEGYVMIEYTTETTTKLKVQITGPSGITYTYNLIPLTWTTYPLSDGNGNYKISVYSNTQGNKYVTLNSLQEYVTLNNEFAPFLTSNQYVNFAQAPNTVTKAKELTGAETDALKKVELVYNYVIKNITYDKDKAQNVKSGYLPNLDSVLNEKKGICFDYAALMAGMLRSQGVPCKLVVGYAGTAYHAWISVYTSEYGWINGAIYFDGSQWQRMDPTFASSGNQSEAIMSYIGNGANYDAKYFY